MSIIGWIIIGGLAGWIASMIMGTNDKQGCLTDIIVGIIGAFVFGWLYWFLTGRENLMGFNLVSLVVAVVGACIVLAIKKAISGRR